MGRGRPPADINVDQLRRLYVCEGKSMVEVAKILKTNRETIRKRLHAAARAGRPIPADPQSIRAALQADMEAWRSAFRISRSDWQGERQQWLDSRGEMSAAEWALMRERWFAARDAWIAQQIGWAQARAQ